MYRERASSVDGAVLWAAEGGGVQSILPDGCMDVILLDGELIVAGPDTRAQRAESRAGSVTVGIRCAPGTAPRLLGVPANELRDARVRLDSIWSPAEVRELTDRVSSDARPARALDAALSVRWRSARLPSVGAELDIVRLLRAGHSAAGIATMSGYSERQFRRRSLETFGYGLKTLHRIVRFQDALRMIESGRPLALVASAAGYADQAHLSREVMNLAGVTPTQLAG